MKSYIGKWILTAAFLGGLTAGILYANLTAKKYLEAAGIFSSFFLSRYPETSVDKTDFFLYILKIRLLPVLGMFLAGISGLRKAAALGVMIWYGFLAGVLFVTSIMQLGWKGMILSLLGLFPHILFYIFAYAVIIWALFAWQQVKWTPSKTVFVILVLSMGILMEVYVNPLILKFYLKAL